MRYAAGRDMRKDPAEAFKWLLEAAKSGNVQAQARVGRMSLEAEGTAADFSEGLKWLERAANAGDEEAQTDLGELYLQGVAAARDFGKAMNWFQRASKQGNARAQMGLGTMYAQGQGVPKDMDLARGYLEKAASQKEPQALYFLGLMYLAGEGVPRDNERAFGWFMQAAQATNVKAQVQVALMYLNGAGVEKNPGEFIKWLRAAAQRNDPRAEYLLGTAYAKGLGVSEDAREALRWYRTSGGSGEPDAQTEVGVSYLRGTGCEPDWPRAYGWTVSAASQGRAIAQCNLGIMYQEGLGIPKVDAEALKWFYVSASQGYAEAVARASQLAAALPADQVREAKRWADEFKPAQHPVHIDDANPVVGARVGDVFVIAATVFGKEACLLVDTGSDATYLDSSFRSRLGEPVMYGARRTYYSQGPEKIAYYAGPDIAISNRVFTPETVACCEMASLSTAMGKRCDGILGMDVLGKYVLRVDPDESQLSIGGGVPEAVRRGSLALPASGGKPGQGLILDATLAGTPLPLRLDTGIDDFVTLRDDDWQKVFRGRQAPTLTGSTARGYGEVGARISRIGSLLVGTNSYTNVIVLCYTNSKLPSTLGEGFIRRHSITVDFPNFVVYISPGKHFQDIEELDMSGLGLGRVNGKTVVLGVGPGSPALLAGAKESDEVLLINSKPTESLSLRNIQDMLKSKPGDAIVLTIERDGKRRDLRFVLRRLI
jgi:TPR repeat protein